MDLEKLIQLLLHDKRTNPSNYALVVLSEGATWEGYTVQERGEPTHTDTARRRAWLRCSPTRSEANWRGDDHLRPHL